MLKTKSISVLSHIFYNDGFTALLPELKNLAQLSSRFYFNLCCTNENKNIIAEITAFFPEALIIQTPNRGKDIGAKLALIDLQIKLCDQSDYTIVLHDKRSPHTSTGKVWRDKLLKIASVKYIDLILNEFESDQSVGIVGAKEFVLNEYDKEKSVFNCTSNDQLKLLINTLSLKNEKFEFIGGTMFWVRTDIYRTFFKTFTPLSIRASLEDGNIMDFKEGSITHAWERILSWIVLNSGYTIKGI